MTNDITKAGLNAAALAGMASALTAASQEVGPSAGGKDILKMTQEEEWLAGIDGAPVTENVMVNPASFTRGWIAWVNSRPFGETMAPLNQPMPDKAGLPHADAVYQEQWAFDCAEKGTGRQMVFKTSSMGGIEALKSLGGAIGAQMTADPDHMVAEVELDSTSYTNKRHGGTTAKPIFTVVAWHANDGEPDPGEPQEAPAPAVEQPAPPRKRQRRSAA